jgi:hypothetical protein
LSQLFAARGYGRVQADRQLRTVWQQVAGDEIAGQTRVGGIKGGVLHVGVANSALLGELVSFLKAELLRKMNAEHAELRVRDIKFRLESRVAKRSASSSQTP